MEFCGRVFLASIEEDNAQRALFRVRPLLDTQGPVRAEEIEELGDEGYLRIVPDRHEQYSFKERMRTLGDLCIIDFEHIEPEANKVRPNKNYAPGRGENNRFVLYSDAVRSLSERQLFEVVADPKAHAPLTAHYYQRSGGHIQGPFNKADNEAVDALSCIAPDSDRLFALTQPGGRERLFFWPEELEVKEPAPLPEGLSATERIRLMDAQLPKLQAGEEELPEAPAPQAPPQRLSGTPLLRGSLRGSRIGRGNNLQQEQSSRRSPALAEDILTQQLQGLEAERLALVIELSQLREDRQALLREALADQAGLALQEQQQARALNRDIAQLREQLATLTDQRQSLLAELEAPVIAPRLGERVSLDMAVKLLHEGLHKAGFELQRDDAAHLLLLVLLFPSLRLHTPHAADTGLAAFGIAHALGAAVAQPDAWGSWPELMPAGDGFVMAIGEAFPGPQKGLFHLKAAAPQEEANAWPGFALRPRAGFVQAQAVQGEALSREYLLAQAEGLSRDLPEALIAQLNQIDSKLSALHKPLPLCLRQDMLRYLAIAQGLLQGGAPAALDYACLSFLLPFARQAGIEQQLLKPLLAELPLCQAAL